MTTITIFDKKTLSKKLKTYGIVGISLATLAGTTWFTPRAWNQFSITDKNEELSILVEKGQYAEANKRFNEFQAKDFLSRTRVDAERKTLYESIRIDANRQATRFVNADDYASAMVFLKTIQNGKLLENKEIIDLEKIISAAHPTNMVARADASQNRSEQNKLYLAADKGFGQLKDQASRVKLSSKIVSGYLETLSGNYADTTIQNNIAPIRAVAKYLDSLPAVSKIEESNIKGFIDKTGDYLKAKIFKDEANTEAIKSYFELLNNVLLKISPQTHKANMANLAGVYLDYTKTKMANNSVAGKNELAILGTARELNQRYNLGRGVELLEDYVNAFNSSQTIETSRLFLSGGVGTYLCLEDGQGKAAAIKLAKAEIVLGNKIEDPLESLALLNLAQQVYLRAGLDRDDPAIQELQKNIDARSDYLKHAYDCTKLGDDAATKQRIATLLNESKRYADDDMMTLAKEKYNESKELYGGLRSPDKALEKTIIDLYQQKLLPRARTSDKF